MGKEYMDRQMGGFCREKGIRVETGVKEQGKKYKENKRWAYLYISTCYFHKIPATYNLYCIYYVYNVYVVW